MARFGVPSRVPARSSESVLIVEPVLGLDTAQPSVDAPLGSTPNSDNYIMREGALEPRPMLSLRSNTPQPFGTSVIAGAYELVSVTNVRTPLASGITAWSAYGLSSNPNGWSVLSYVSSYGLNDPPNLTGGADYWNFTQSYYALRDQNVAIGAAGSYQTLYCTQSDSTIFSSLTGAPRAKYVAAMDDYLMTFNSKDGNGTYVQRALWSDRGSTSSWTGGLSGFEDLLSMKGQGTRVVTHDNKFLLFSDQEIWQGVEGTFPFVWSFAPFDTTRGCPYSWTIVSTPLGTVFLGKDYQIYLIPKGGGQARPIGQALHRTIRSTIDQPTRAWAIYDNTLSQYQLYYAIKGGSGYPQRAVYLQLGPQSFSPQAQWSASNVGSWAPQSFDRPGGGISLTRGAEVYVNSGSTTWGNASKRWADTSASWAEMGGLSEARAVLVGSSAGTLYYFNSDATNDNGTEVESKWDSSGLVGDEPNTQKTLSEFRVDYQADSASSLTVKFSQTLGATYGVQTQLNLPAVSGMSQAIAYPYIAARYPSFEISSVGQRYRIFRMWAKFRRGGR